MPIITDIKEQKRPGRVSVYIDGKFALGMSLWQVARLHLSLKKEISVEDLKRLALEAEFGKMYDKALVWLSLRKRSAWEVNDYLRRKTDDEDLHERIYQELEQNGYVDDAAFAESWVSNRRATKLVSIRRLQQELRAKRVENSVISSVLSEDETEDNDILSHLIEKKRRQTKYQDNTKLMQYLGRQGFSYGDIKDALEDED